MKANIDPQYQALAPEANSDTLTSSKSRSSNTLSGKLTKLISPSWPVNPQELELGYMARLSKASLDILLVFLPLCFLTHGIILVSLRNLPQSRLGDSILEVAQVTSTLYPLIFSAILAGLLKNLAHNRIQSGSKLGFIEQLMGSRSLLSTLTIGYTFRELNFTLLSLLFVWAWSPLGGQGALRAMTKVIAIDAKGIQLSYMALDPRTTRKYFILPSRSSEGNYANVPQILFGAALMSNAASLHHLNRTEQQYDFDKQLDRLGGSDAAIQASTKDSWGRARIPIIDLLPDFDQNTFDNGDWIDVSTDQVIPYSSAFGIPVLNLPSEDAGNASFIIESAYTRFMCDDWITGRDFEKLYNRSEPSFQYGKPSFKAILGHSEAGSLHEFQTTRPFEYPPNDDSFQLELAPNGTSCDISERELLFYSSGDYGIICRPKLVYLEASIACSRGLRGGQLQCATDQIRQLLDEAQLCPTITEIDMLNTTSYNPLAYMMSTLRYSVDGTPPSVAEQFLVNPTGVLKNTTWIRTGSSQFDYNMTWISPLVFGSRLSMLWNTWSMASKANGLLSGYEFIPMDYSQQESIPLLVNDSMASWRYEIGEIYEIDTLWVCIYLASIILMLVCSLCAAALKFRLDIPEILGRVSSLTKDTPYVSTSSPTAGSTLSGDDRAMLLKDLYIRVQDVKPGETVGRLAISSCSKDVAERTPLDKYKHYE